MTIRPAVYYYYNCTRFSYRTAHFFLVTENNYTGRDGRPDTYARIVIDTPDSSDGQRTSVAELVVNMHS